MSIPLIIAKVQLAQSDEVRRTPTEYEVESMIAHNNEPTASIEVQIVELDMVEAHTETHTEPEFIPYNVPLDITFQKQIKAICDREEVYMGLVLSIMKTESEFIWNVGDSGESIGYMQIQPRWWSELAAEAELDIYTPQDNVECGVLILKYLLNEYDGDLRRALNAYNTGNPDCNNGYADRVIEGIYGK